MNKPGSRKAFLAGGLLLAVVLVFFLGRYGLQALQGDEPVDFSVDPGFGNYISAFTSGYIGQKKPIVVRFTQDLVTQEELNTPLDENYFDFSPNIAGLTQWEDSRTLVFLPTEPMQRGQTYEASLELGELLEVEPEYETFNFRFVIRKQGLETPPPSLLTVVGDSSFHYRVEGYLLTADEESPENIQEVMKATLEGKRVDLEWEHEADGRTHHYQIDSLQRTDDNQVLLLNWDGSPIEVDEEGELRLEIPARSRFNVMAVHVRDKPERHIEVIFSNPLNTSQSLEGLITLVDFRSLRFDIQQNRVFIYPTRPLLGKQMLQVNPGILDVEGRKLDQASSHDLYFPSPKPEIRAMSKGIIMPDANELYFGFEAINLRAVEVKVIRIFENNVPYFLQNNSLGGDNDLYRFSRVVARKVIRLNAAKREDLKRWRKYGVDLAPLIQQEPGAIYRLVISYKPAYIAYDCAGQPAPELVELEELTSLEEEELNRYSDGYKQQYGPGYNWREADNPCNPAYYKQSRMILRNLLASNLGVTAKQSEDNQLFIAVSSILDAKPLQGVQVRLLDAQMQPQGEFTTNAEGLITTQTERATQLLIAEHDGQKSYLSLRSGLQLSTSMFEVEGAAVKKGVKGLIYGERGVWRPGDTLFLTFLLHDPQKRIPERHPVTLELYTPQGQLYAKRVSVNGQNGFYPFPLPTEPQAPTGAWEARVEVGGVSFSRSVRVETVRPNRLKIELDFNTTQLNARENPKATLKTRWLTGAKASNLRAQVEATFRNRKTAFKGYPNFHFQDFSRRLNADAHTLFDGQVNEQGVATIDFEAPDKLRAPGMLDALFTTRVYERGGGYSIHTTSLPYSPYDSYVGMRLNYSVANQRMLYTNREHRVDFVTLDRNGNPVSRSNIQVEVYQLRWSWWWEDRQGRAANFVIHDWKRPVKNLVTQSRNGRGTFKLFMEHGDHGRYFVRITDPVSGHSTGQVVYFDWANWMDRDDERANRGASILNFNSDKETYAVGEPIRITTPSPEGARMLVTLENGSQVLDAQWIKTQAGETTFELEATSEMSPNVYVNISLIQPHQHPENDLPLRMYGVLPIQVEDPATHLHPQLKTPRVWRPEQQATLQVSEANGQACTYTVAVVDEGLLDLTNFATPNPWESFYAKEAHGVVTWDLFDDVLGAYAAELERVLTIGGDTEGLKQNARKANRFKPVVKFLGPFNLKRGETQTHRFRMPDYIGSVRTMVVAGNRRSYGFAETTTAVRKPLMVLGSLPRLLSPQETVQLPATVFAMNNSVKQVTVRVETNELLTLQGPASKTIRFNSTGEKLVPFQLAVANRVGLAKVKLIASSGSERAEHEIELNVRAPNPLETRVQSMLLKPGESRQMDYTAFGLAKNSATLEVSALPPLNLKKRLSYLVRYPHGCLEQTVSSAFPQLYLHSLVELSQDRRQRIQANVKSALQKLRNFQLTNGGFAYWPGANTTSAWSTTYALHFLLEAKAAGYAPPPGMLNRALAYQAQAARNWRLQEKQMTNSSLNQAYRLYTLSLGGKAELGAMNRLRNSTANNLAAKWRLAAAYTLVGYSDQAKDLVNNLGTAIQPYKRTYQTFGSRTRDQAMILETLALLKQEARAARLLKTIAREMSASRWMSTQTTAYCFIGVSAFVKSYGEMAEAQFRVKVNGRKMHEGRQQGLITQVDLPFKQGGKGEAQIHNDGTGPLFAQLITQGVLPIGQEETRAQNLQLQVDYKTLSGAPLRPDSLPQGTDLMVELRITHPGSSHAYRELALEHFIPSGWEIRNARMDAVTAAQAGQESKYDYRDIRDDRVYTYFDLKAGETKTFRVLVNAAYAGRYYLPAVSCSAMYNASISARTSGQWVRVYQP